MFEHENYENHFIKLPRNWYGDNTFDDDGIIISVFITLLQFAKLRQETTFIKTNKFECKRGELTSPLDYFAIRTGFTKAQIKSRINILDMMGYIKILSSKKGLHIRIENFEDFICQCKNGDNHGN